MNGDVSDFVPEPVFDALNKIQPLTLTASTEDTRTV